MRVALGLKAHSGWAALVALGVERGELRVAERRRIELVDNRHASAPYHAADGLPLAQAQRIVDDSIEEARRTSGRELRATLERLGAAGHEVAACAVLMPRPMPDFSVEQILAVHVRMHQAEGMMFPQALAQAVASCGLTAHEIPEKDLRERASSKLGQTPEAIAATIARLGKSVGAPWGADQKNAALAAWIALHDQRA